MPSARIQPQGRVRLNRANRLTKGALAVVSASADFNIATGAKLNVAGPRTKVARSSGIASQFRKNWYFETDVLPAIGTQTFVEFWHGYPIAFGAGGSATEAAFVTGSANNQQGIFLNGRNGGTTWGAIYSWTGLNDTAQVLPLGVLTTLVCVRRQGSMELWRAGPDGVATLAGSFNQSPASYPATSLILGSFIQDAPYWSSSSDTVLAGRIVNDWSVDDVKSFCRNPWQLLEGQAPMLYAASAPAVLLAMLEAGAAADGSSATVISAAAAAEAGAAADASQSTTATVASTTETGAAAEATTGVVSTVGVNAEVLTAADSISTGATTSAASAEAGAVADTSGAQNAGVASTVETGAATDSRSAIATLAAATADALTAADASSTSGAATGVSTVEAGAAAETTSSTQQCVAATNEAAAASDTPGATMATTAGRSDALTTADLQQTGGTIISASVAESGAVADFVLASYMLAAQATEGASASDWLAASFMGVASISENSPAIDITSGRWITSAAVTDALAALALTTAQLGGQLKPNPHRTYVGRARIRSLTGATRIRSM